MRITSNATLECWLAEKSTGIVLPVEVPIEQFEKELASAVKMHSEYNAEQLEAWAAWNCLFTRERSSSHLSPARNSEEVSPTKNNRDYWAVWAWRIAVLLSLWLLLAMSAFGQAGPATGGNAGPSQGTRIQIRDEGTVIKTWSPGVLVQLNCVGVSIACAWDAANNRVNVTVSAGGSSPLTTKGDIHGFSTVDARLAVGTNGQCLTADSAQTLGLLWGACGSGSPHNLLSATHPDTVAGAPVRGSIIYANLTPAWVTLGVQTAGKYPKWDGTDLVPSSGAASGVGSPTACTNQVVTAFTLNADAAPTSTCNTITSAYTSGTFPATAHNLLSATHGDTVATSPVFGDILFGNVTPAWDKLAGNTTTTKKFLRQTGTGAASAAPAWDTIVKADLPATVVHTDQANTYTTGAQDMGSATSLVVPKAAGAAPTAQGDVRYDTTRNAMVAGGNQSTTGFLPRVLKMTNCTTEANCTGANQVNADAAAQGTTETNFASNWSMPANFLFTNKAIQVCAAIEVSTSASAPTLTIRFKLGATAVSATGAFGPGPSLVTKGYFYCAVIQGTAAAGAAVNVEGSGYYPIGLGGALIPNNLAQPVAGIATNGALTVQVSAQWGTATTGNTAQQHQFFVMEL